MGKLNYIRNPQAGASSADLAALKTKVDNLANIAVKNNLANQSIPQQRINQSPSHEENIIRLADIRFQRLVNQTSALNTPNQVWEWTVSGLENLKLHTFIIKVAVAGVDYLFSWSGWIENKNYKNMGPTFSFAKDNNFNESAKVKTWIENGKFKMISSVAVNSISVYLKKEYHL